MYPPAEGGPGEGSNRAIVLIGYRGYNGRWALLPHTISHQSHLQQQIVVYACGMTLPPTSLASQNAHFVRRKLAAEIRKPPNARYAEFSDCSFGELRKWIESQLQPGRTWSDCGHKWKLYCYAPDDPYHWSNMYPMSITAFK